MNTITIDLRDRHSATGILAAFDEVFQFGKKPPSKKFFGNPGWGYNWSAFSDCMSCLDRGGIHGTSPLVEFPVHLHILYADLGEGFASRFMWTLYEILEKTRRLYRKHSLTFSFDFERQSATSRPSLWDRTERLFW